jgi:two-component system chemotaxis response regulator CheB
MQPKIISILVLDDSLPFRNIVHQAIQGSPDLCLLPETGAENGLEQVLGKLLPDVAIIDEVSPPGGVSLSECLDCLRLSQNACFTPCIVIGPERPGTDHTVDEYGAEFIKLPESYTADRIASFKNEICTKIRFSAHAAAAVRLSSKRLDNGENPVKTEGASEVSHSLQPTSGEDFRYHIIAIGASTGGTEATAQIIRNLPHDMPGIVITQHMPPDFTRMYADRLNRISKLDVSEARDGKRVMPGTAVVAAGGLQMYLKKDAEGYYVHCAPGKKVNGHCPSVGVLFDSVAQCAGRDAIGVILTGMGNDGAEALLRMRQAGAYTIGQDRETCVVYGMPMVANQIGAVMQQASIEQIADILTSKIH